jgi:integrase
MNADTDKGRLKKPEKGWVRLRAGSACWYFGFMLNGKRGEWSSRSTDEREAWKQLRQKLTAAEAGAFVPGKEITVAQAFADVVNDYRVNGKKSRAHVERRIRKHLTPWFGARKFSTVTTSQIRAYVAARQTDGASNASINRELAILKRAFVLALQSGAVFRRPYVPMLEERNVRTGFFEREQFDAVRAHLPEPLRPIATLAYWTGWRKGEIVNLQWRNVDRQEGILTLDPGTTKNEKGRVFPYRHVDDLRDMIDAQWAAHEQLTASGTICPWVFHRDGARVASFYGAWRTACRLAGVPGKLLHDCRRTAARNLVRAGVPERVAMQITGHLTRSIFDRYNITSETDLHDAAQKLNECFGRTVPEAEKTQTDHLVLSLRGTRHR